MNAANDSLRLAGIGRDAMDPCCLHLYFNEKPTDDDMRRIHELVRDGGAASVNAQLEDKDGRTASYSGVAGRFLIPDVGEVLVFADSIGTLRAALREMGQELNVGATGAVRVTPEAKQPHLTLILDR